MTQATEIMASARNANDAMTAAEEITSNIDQHWDHREATVYQFEDESVLWVSGGQVNAYESIDQANAANPAS